MDSCTWLYFVISRGGRVGQVLRSSFTSSRSKISLNFLKDLPSNERNMFSLVLKNRKFYKFLNFYSLYLMIVFVEMLPLRKLTYSAWTWVDGLLSMLLITSSSFIIRPPRSGETSYSILHLLICELMILNTSWSYASELSYEASQSELCDNVDILYYVNHLDNFNPL